ncbi:M20/M25/M40 family metallo-hydrolase [Jeotgalibaca sp. MA1X17-3]|uniref:M20/M25/M40 family metallo-hydrolase n=1 Tax=Jeotgalibaca sp. MA1X17-3 TaxID=2908211 RepID=UPI001F2A3F03|nr:M20/M25/M40 family metallo-hydrolase [Jeotgalibaca sp. MA1X17-3]UJF15215.1 M20/M25/M40 family metallo-hydrolase [Jeotgalibaca sp. MA1X17-3]
MSEPKWQTKTQLQELLSKLVGWGSVTLSEGERLFPHRLREELLALDYFSEHPDQISLVALSEKRSSLSALYLHPEATKTVVVFGHFDTVPIEDFGEQQSLATQPELLTAFFEKNIEHAPKEVQEDIKSGEYLFGRGVMDMKMGVALNMQTLEKAILEQWKLNIVFLAVCDEEVNSEGMRAATPHLLALKEKYNLDYQMGILTEPVFRNDPRDNHFTIYTGTVGKVLLGALVYGKETHAGEPLSGITSPYLASFLTQEMEWNEAFLESDLGEKMQPPVVLQQKDMLLSYSVQTPLRTSILFNVFQMKRSIAEIYSLYEQTAQTAVEKANHHYEEKCKQYDIQPMGEVRVIRYDELLRYAKNKMGEAAIERIEADIVQNSDWDVREKSLRIADSLMMACKELAPAVVLLLAPPYYPAVSFSGDEFIEECNEKLLEIAGEVVHFPAQRVHYFNGLCDMSYTAYQGDESEYKVFEENAPILGDEYSIPFKQMQELNLPTMVVGPYGKDPHKYYERLNKKNAFEEMPILFERFFHYLMDTAK